MAGTPLTRQLYDLMVASYRECPGNASHAARKCGCDRRMARRGWEKGWPRYTWALPIREVLANEAKADEERLSLAKRRAAEEAIADAEQRRVNTKEARDEEDKILRIGRRDVLGTLVMAAELVPAMRVLSKVVNDAIINGKIQGIEGAKMAMNFLQRHATLVSKAVYAADAMVKLSRIDRGQPSAVVGIDQELDADMSYEEAVAELEDAAEVLALVRGKGALPADLEVALIEAEGTAVPRIDAGKDINDYEPVEGADDSGP
jgi:hypothetical protein